VSLKEFPTSPNRAVWGTRYLHRGKDREHMNIYICTYILMYIYMYSYTHVYIYLYVCVYVCAYESPSPEGAFSPENVFSRLCQRVKHITNAIFHSAAPWCRVAKTDRIPRLCVHPRAN